MKFFSTNPKLPRYCMENQQRSWGYLMKYDNPPSPQAAMREERLAARAFSRDMEYDSSEIMYANDFYDYLCRAMFGWPHNEAVYRTWAAVADTLEDDPEDWGGVF